MRNDIPSPPPWAQVPMLFVAFALVIGIALGWIFRESIHALVCFAIACTALVCVVYVRWKNSKSNLACISAESVYSFRRTHIFSIAFIALSIASTGAGLLSNNYQDVLTSWPDKQALWIGKVKSINKQHIRGTQADIEIQQGANKGKRVRTFFQDKQTELQPGQCIAFHARIREPQNNGNPGEFNYRTFLLTHNISGTCYVASDQWNVLPSEGNVSLQERMLQLRDRMVRSYETYFKGQTLAIISALTLGDKTILSSDTRDLFSLTGTSHILALSGLHLGILFSIFRIILLRHCHRRFSFISASLLAIAGLWLFVLLCGQTPSLVRSATMLTLLHLLLCVNRASSTLNNLTLTAIIMLTASPFSLFDVGFQLSFTSVLSITLFHTYVWRRVRILSPLDETVKEPKRWQFTTTKRFVLRSVQFRLHRAGRYALRALFGFISVSLSAQLGTAALVLYYFHTLSPLAFVANFVVIPAAYIIIGCGIAFFVLPFLQNMLAMVVGSVITVMTHSLEFMAQIPVSHVQMYPSSTTLLLLTPCIILLFSFIIKRRKWMLYLLTLFVSISCGAELYAVRPSRIDPQIIVYNVSRTTAVHCIASAESSYLFTTLPSDSTREAMSYISRTFWAANKMQYPHFLTEHNGNKQIMLRRNFIVFGNKIIAIAGNEQLSTQNNAPIKVDALVVGKECRLPLRALLKAYHPKTVVLSPTLPEYRRTLISDDCSKEHLPFHDASEQGAFILPLKS